MINKIFAGVAVATMFAMLSGCIVRNDSEVSVTAEKIGFTAPSALAPVGRCSYKIKVTSKSRRRIKGFHGTVFIKDSGGSQIGTIHLNLDMNIRSGESAYFTKRVRGGNDREVCNNARSYDVEIRGFNYK